MKEQTIETLRVILVSIMERYKSYWDHKGEDTFFYRLEEGAIPFSGEKNKYVLSILVGINKAPTIPLVRSEHIAEIGRGGTGEVLKRAIIDLGNAGLAKIFTDTTDQIQKGMIKL